jgi:sugar diacid utilization regulator
MVRLLSDDRGLRPGDLDRLGAMGAREAENDMPLEVLLGAYRIAARVLWQDVISESVKRNELPTDTVVAATAYVLEYLDQISGAVGKAYLETRERIVLQRDRDRERILIRLVAGDVSDQVQQLAAASDLELAPPYRVVAFTTTPQHKDAVDAHWRQTGALLVPSLPGITLALLHPSQSVRDIVKTLGDIGITSQCCRGPVADTLADIQPAAKITAEALAAARVLHPDKTHVEFTQLAPFAVLNENRFATDAFIHAELSAFDSLTQKQRDQALATVDAVLGTQSLAAAAEALGLHRHTLVYRLEKLRERGINLTDAEARNRLWLARQMSRLAAV